MSEISGVTAIAGKFPKHAVNACQRSILPPKDSGEHRAAFEILRRLPQASWALNKAAVECFPRQVEFFGSEKAGGGGNHAVAPGPFRKNQVNADQHCRSSPLG